MRIIRSLLNKWCQKPKDSNGFPANALFIDVSHEIDYVEEHFEGAINIPLEKLHSTINLLQKYTVPIVIVSNCEVRTDEAVDILFDAGVLAYNGGDWRKL